MSTMYEDVDMENPDGVYGDGSDVCDGLIGVVVNCLSLNIREKASADSNVIAEAKALDELKIDMANSNDDWYAVCTVAGIEGFCMKKCSLVWLMIALSISVWPTSRGATLHRTSMRICMNTCTSLMKN